VDLIGYEAGIHWLWHWSYAVAYSEYPVVILTAPGAAAVDAMDAAAVNSEYW
jgi:hypothetical protein